MCFDETTDRIPIIDPSCNGVIKRNTREENKITTATAKEKFVPVIAKVTDQSDYLRVGS